MAEPVLKLAPQPAALAPPTAPEAPASKEAPAKQSLRGALRARLRLILLVIVPLVAALAGVGLYLTGGRYISTDNAYVGARKVLITPDISGRVGRVLVREGQHVAAADALFEIDPVPFRLAVTQAQSKLDSVRTDFAN